MDEFVNRVRLHWNHFLLLENDFKTILRYIEPENGNKNAYGPELVKLLLSCGSEVDVVLKDIYECVDPQGFWMKQIKRNSFGAHLNITHYREFVTNLREWPFKNAEIGMSLGKWSAIPWKSWWYATPRSPEWWTSYNAVKHNRVIAYDSATLFNAFSSLAALFIAVVDLARVTGVSRMTPCPTLLEFVNPLYGEAGFVEMEGSVLTIRKTIAFNVNVDAETDTELLSSTKHRIELATKLRGMKSADRLAYLKNLKP